MKIKYTYIKLEQKIKIELEYRKAIKVAKLKQLVTIELFINL